MPRYPILTPFRFKDAVHKAGHIEMDARTAATYLQADVIGPAVADGAANPMPPVDSNPASGTDPSNAGSDASHPDTPPAPDAEPPARAPAQPKPAPAAGQPRR
jgi:hypothetical protein